MDEITININLLDRPYRLSVARADEEKVRKAGNNLYLVGDLVTGISAKQPPAAPRVNIAAAMEANTVIALLLGMEI